MKKPVLKLFKKGDLIKFSGRDIKGERNVDAPYKVLFIDEECIVGMWQATHKDEQELAILPFKNNTFTKIEESNE